MASLLNDFFIYVFNKKEILETDGSTKDNSNQDIKLEKIQITDRDVLRAISDFKENKSPGVDAISST